MPTYSQQDLNRIATALGLSSDEVLKYRNGFEAAATTYRLNIPPAKRAGGPTFELRNRCPKNVKKPSELRKKHSKKPKTLSELRKKAKQVEAAAKKLLLHLGVRRPAKHRTGQEMESS